MSVHTVLATAIVVIRKNTKFHLNVNVHCRKVYSRNVYDGKTLERKILLPNLKGVSKVFSPRSVIVVAIVNTCPGIHVSRCDTGKFVKKSNAKKDIYFNLHAVSTNARVQLQLVVKNVTDVADWTDAPRA